MAAQKDLDFGMKCIKYMLCMANLMFVIVGLLLISIGYTIKAIYSNFDKFMETYYYNPSTLAVVIGFFIFIIAMFGCVGAFKESTCLVNTYAFFLTIVLVLELSLCIAAYAMRTNITNSIYQNMKQAMDRFDVEFNAFTWNATQYNLQCCGIFNSTDWNAYADRDFGLVGIEIDNNTMLYVPPTCCIQEQCLAPNFVHPRGCMLSLTQIVSQCALLLAVGALCVSFIQVLGIIFASLLAKSIRKVKTQILVNRDELRRNFYKEMVKNEEKEKPKSPMLYTPKYSEA